MADGGRVSEEDAKDALRHLADRFEGITLTGDDEADERKACRFGGADCPDEATHEVKEADSTRWRPVCEDHAEHAHHYGLDVRRL